MRTVSARTPRAVRGRPAALTAAALATTLALAACSSGAGSDAEGNVLTVGLSGEPQDIHLGADQGGVGYIMDSLVHQGLLKYDAQGEIAPALAQEYEAVDESTYSFTLREGLTFSDDTPLTAEDVRDTYLYLGESANGARTVRGMANIDEIEIVDDTEVVIHLASNDPDFLEYAADPTAFIAPAEALDPQAAATVGAGPFAIDDVTSGVSTGLVRNDAFYAAEDVALDGIDLVYYADATARTNALISGEVDFIDYVAWEDFERLGQTDGLVLDAQPGSTMNIEFNASEGPFVDPLVRQAVAYAVNRDSVASTAFAGHAAPLYGVPLGEGSPYASDLSENMYAYDPDRARELLDEAGHADGIQATLLTSSQYAFYQDTALTVQADLAEVGIDVTLDSVDWATRSEKSTSGDYDLKIGGGGGIVTGPAYLEAWITGPEIARSYGYENDELVEAFDDSSSASSEEERAQAYDQAFEVIREDVPMVNLVQRDQGFAYKDTLDGFVNLPGFLTFYSGYTLATASLSE